jgi:hypothetical protein
MPISIKDISRDNEVRHHALDILVERFDIDRESVTTTTGDYFDDIATDFLYGGFIDNEFT